MLDRLRAIECDRLDVDEYRADFARHSVEGVEGWKLEVRQEFQEPGNEWWLASTQGQWEESLRLIEEARQLISSTIKEPPFPFRRVRVVRQPLTPYLEWELRSLLMRCESGEDVRIFEARSDEHLQWPEVVVLGTAVAYEVCYTESGILDGARRTTDAAAVAGLQEDIAALLERSTDIRRALDLSRTPSLVR
jgi:hypothetical protein